MYAPYTYGLPKNYEDIFNKFSKIQKPTEAIHTKPERHSKKRAVCNEVPDPFWSPHITKRKSNQKKYVFKILQKWAKNQVGVGQT